MRPGRRPDPTGTGHKHRWECPAGHSSWERVNSHIVCHACIQERHQNPEVDPEWHQLRDKKTGELVDFAELKGEWPPFTEVRAY